MVKSPHGVSACSVILLVVMYHVSCQTCDSNFYTFFQIAHIVSVNRYEVSQSIVIPNMEWLFVPIPLCYLLPCDFSNLQVYIILNNE